MVEGEEQHRTLGKILMNKSGFELRVNQNTAMKSVETPPRITDFWASSNLNRSHFPNRYWSSVDTHLEKQWIPIRPWSTSSCRSYIYGVGLHWLDMLPCLSIMSKPNEEKVYKSKISFLGVPKHLKQPISAKVLDGFHKRVKGLLKVSHLKMLMMKFPRWNWTLSS